MYYHVKYVYIFARDWMPHSICFSDKVQNIKFTQNNLWRFMSIANFNGFICNSLCVVWIFTLILITVILESNGKGFVSFEDVYSIQCLRMWSRNVTKLWADLWNSTFIKKMNSAASWTSINLKGTVSASSKEDASCDRSWCLKNTNIK